MKINCDIGERGINNVIDQELMTLIDIANLACGGHAGDSESVQFFRDLAEKNDVQVSAHLSYPDRVNFGRLSMKLDRDELLDALDQQHSLVKDVKWVKFHGALYNDLNANKSLAKLVYTWLEANEIEVLLCPQKSAIAELCHQHEQIQVLAELFAERAYIYDQEADQFALMPRQQSGAVLKDLEEALAQSEDLLLGRVLTQEEDGRKVLREIHGESICIHSDAKIALELAKELRSRLA
ncbi:LamB/YcsF family protein [Lentisphaera marina]|uniref:LamB/YcsF family protein n=1 Tax=Lentisphaera marina TaxID=1111041 RepID=UPI002366BA54|nr:LamB/YcsF family protein [Lentisphaera marina]MDD7986772.1 LamB/YcsF family protein [Lentisphaera marina]